jgi:hypothetical protein
MSQIGFDPGYGNTKIYGDGGGLALPSHVAIKQNGHLGRMEGMQLRRPPLAVTVDERAFYVGAGAHDWGVPVESLDYTRLSGSPEVRATLYAALSQYQRRQGAVTSPISLIVGLPLGALGDEGRSIGAEMKAWLSGSHTWQANETTHHITIDQVLVTSQATAALYDYILDENGRFLPDRAASLHEEVGVVSVGFNTLELMVIRDKRPVARFTGGSKHGVRTLLQAMNGPNAYSLGELDDRLRAGLADGAALDLWLSGVSGQIEKQWGDRWRGFAQVILVGGGALLLRSQLSGYFRGKSHLPDEPVLAVARGLYKLLRLQNGRRGGSQ